MTQTFKIEYPMTKAGKTAWNREYGMNAIYAGKHWSKRRQDAQLFHMLTVAAMNKYKCQLKPFEVPVVIEYFWNDRMDLSNHAYIAKLIEDGMKGRLIKDDSGKYVVGIYHHFHDEDCIMVKVEEEKK